jgi:hypothetical protein
VAGLDPDPMRSLDFCLSAPVTEDVVRVLDQERR